jgi:hypothetical protein
VPTNIWVAPVQVRPDDDEDEDHDDLCKPTADGLSDLGKLLQRPQRHEDGLLEPWRAALQQTRDCERCGDERRDREDNERRHRQTQRVAWISLATAVVATVISVLT